MVEPHADCAQIHDRSSRRIARQGPTSQRYRHHTDCSYGARTSGCIPNVCTATSTPRKGSLLAHFGRTEGGSVIAADTSTWIAFLQGDQGADIELLDRALEDRQVLMA